MEGLIVIIGIIFSIISTINKSKDVKKNAPGKAAAPARPAARPTTAPVHPAPTVRPTVHPTAQAPQPAQTFWQEIGGMLKEELQPETPDKGHEAAGKMAEGDSRECDHGSLGGSMAYEGHQEGREKRKAAKPDRSAGEPAADTALYRPAMNAQEMRRAVVMAEILKRPQERMTEQARRWSVR